MDNTLIGFASTNNAIIQWDIYTALLISSNPTLYVKKCVHPKTVVALTQYFRKRIGFNPPKKYFKNYPKDEFLKLVEDYYYKSVQELCYDIFKIAENYIDVSYINPMDAKVVL